MISRTLLARAGTAAVAVFCISISAGAQVRLVKDIAEPMATGSSPEFKLVDGNRTFFTAYTANYGTELWVTDGTTAGTRMVKDNVPGKGSTYFAGSPRSVGADFVSYRGQVYWRGTTSSSRFELWRTDGTPGGTGRVFVVTPVCSSNADVRLGAVHWAVPFSSGLFFLADDCGQQLFRFDESTGATSRVVDGSFRSIHSVNGHFVAISDTTVYFSDDPRAGLANGLPGFVNVGVPFESQGGLLFLDQSISGRRLWFTDGTPAGTRVVASYAMDFPQRILGLAGSAVLLSDGSGSLYATDMTSGVTAKFPSIGANDAFLSLGGRLLMLGNGLWSTDGTVAGTIQLLGPGTAPYYRLPEFAPMGGKAYFQTSDADHGQETWVTDGTAEGTHLVVDINPGPAGSNPSIVAMGDRLLITGDNATVGRELWVSDGTEGGTQLLSNIAADNGSSIPLSLTSDGTRIYFSAYQSATGWETWVTTGTAEETRLLVDHYPGSFSGAFAPLGSIGNRLFFHAGSGSSGETYVSQGAPENTVALGQTISLLHAFDPWSSVSLPNRIVLTNTAGSLISTDGSSEGTAPLPATGVQQLYCTYRGRAFFTELSDSQLKMGSTDGTAEGTKLAGENRVRQCLAVGDELFVVGGDSTTGTELWISEGVSETTRIVADLTPGSGSSDIGAIAQLSGKLYFFKSASELWQSDGTAAGTYMTTAIPSPLTTLMYGNGSRLFFFANDGSGLELWQSDGTAGGTGRVTDICPGPGSALEGINTARVIAGVLYFPANDCSSGLELWRSDGTAAGTARVADLAPGEESSSPASMAELNGEIYFAAYQPDVGFELFAYRPDTIASTTTLTVSASSITLGGALQVEATVLSGDITGPAGAVEFRVDDEVVKTVVPVGGIASGTLEHLMGGTHSIVARYVGDLHLAPSTSPPAVLAVAPASATLAANLTSTEVTCADQVSITARLDGAFTSPFFPSGVITVRDGTALLVAGPVVNSAATLLLPRLSVGTHVLTVTYDRDSSFTASNVVLTLVVNRATPTLSISGLVPLIDPGAAAYLQISLQVPYPLVSAGSLRLFDGSQLLYETAPGISRFSYDLSTLSVGSHDILIEYSGDANFNPQSSQAQILVTNFPLVTAITPAGVCVGQTAFDFVLDGQYFDATSIVSLNSQPLLTQFGSSSQLRASGAVSQPVNGAGMIRVARTDGAIVYRQIPYQENSASPRVSPPPATTIVASMTEGGVQASNAATSPALKTWLGSGSATDDCTYVPLEKLPLMMSATTLTDTTPVPTGPTAITFAYRDFAGHTSSAVSNLRVIPRGSLDDNFTVTATDMVILANFLVGNVRQGSAPFLSPFAAGDLNDDGKVNSVDLVILANYLVGNITILPAK